MLRHFVRAVIATCLLSSAAQAQLSCDSPAESSLGATQTATLLSFPAFDVGAPCYGMQTIHHAVYHRFTAPQDGWYSLHVIPTDAVSWTPRVAVLSSCDATEAVIQGWPQYGYPLCDEGDGSYRPFTSASFYLQAGQARLLAIGGDTTNDAGSATLHIARIGSTLMDGAQSITLGDNAFAVATREPALPYAGACSGYDQDRMGSASRFSFVPSKTGTYRFSFCDSDRYQIALSASPDLPIDTLITAESGCPYGGRLTAALTAGSTYYLAAGNAFGHYDACSTRNVTVEFIPETQAPDCGSPVESSLGATQTATLLSFPAFDVGAPCQGMQTIHHAVYHRFTAPQDGWYSLHVIATDAVSWRPRVAVLSSCDATEAVIQGWPQDGYPLCDEGDGSFRQFTSASFYLQAGQARLLAIGGDTPNDAGSATLHIARIGSTLMDGAQSITLGDNAFAVAAREPALPYAGACSGYDQDRMGNASRFSFVPSKTGTYRFSFCGSFRSRIALSASPDLPIDTLITAAYSCPNSGGRLTAALTAGNTYYLAAGRFDANYDACSTRNVTVEFVPETQAPDCGSPVESSLGATQTATLLSFPAFSVGAPCQGMQTIHHAVYHRFTAPQDGWYSLHVIPTDAVSWRPRVAVLSSCDATEAVIQGWPQYGSPLCDEGDGSYRQFTSASFYLQAGQARLLAIGGDTPNDAGSVTLHIARIGSTLMDGAQLLTLGDNAFAVAAREPALPYAGACSGYYQDRMGNASRFSFVPSKTGTYRFSFCGSDRNQIALSASPDLPIDTLITAEFGCPTNGGRLTAALTAGNTYYLAAGFAYGYNDACSTRNVTVEFVDPCPADLNGDNIVNGFDLGLVLAAWGTPKQDVTGDAVTDGTDLGILLASWGACETD